VFYSNIRSSFTCFCRLFCIFVAGISEARGTSWSADGDNESAVRYSFMGSNWSPISTCYSPSLMYVLNRKGSATAPCQTPDFTGQEKGRGPRIRTAVCSSTVAALKLKTGSEVTDSDLYQKGVACMPYVVTYSAAETAVSTC